MLSSRLAPLREGVTWARHVLGTALRGPVAQTRTAASEGLPSSLPLAQGRHRREELRPLERECHGVRQRA